MIEIVTLGSFSIKVNGVDITSNFKKTTKLMQLLNILLINRNKLVSANTICDIIWDDDNSDTHKALHNLIYRIRKYFEQNGVKDSIVFNNKTYMLNPQIDIIADIYRFEEYIHVSKSDLHVSEKIAALRNAIEIYNGEYIFNSICGDTYTIPYTLWFKRMFSDAVCTYADICIEQNDFDSALSACYKAITYDSLDEQIYIHAINGLCKKGIDSQAIALIESYYEIMYRETGMRESDILNKIYKELKGPSHNSKSNVNQVLTELHEINSINKALFCGFNLFKDIYRYEVRNQERAKNKVFIVLAEIKCSNDTTTDNEINIAIANKHFHEVCMLTLRKGDMFSVYSPTMTVIMLLLSMEEGLDSVLNRLRESFETSVCIKNAILNFDVQSSVL